MSNNSQRDNSWLMCLPCQFGEKEKNEEINITKKQRKKYARPPPFRKNQHNKSVEMHIKYPVSEGTQQKSIHKIKNLGSEAIKNPETEKDETSRGSTKPNKLSIKKKQEVKRANQIERFENLLNCQYSDYQYR